MKEENNTDDGDLWHI